MVPVRLALKNFLSYGEEVEPLDFSDVHLACLSGSNGHGKSALLDAITWSLWGQARGNSVDDLVRLHQNAMQVEFDFDLDGHRYRVVRKRTRGKTGQSDLQFQVRDEDGSWRALNDGGVRGTQERITALLRMDFETFVNSAFILQGRADEFARKSAGERKRILAEILNLGEYDTLSQRAREKARDADARRQVLEGEIARLEAETRREPERAAEVERLERETGEARLRCESLRADLNQALVRKTALDARRRERDDLERRLRATAGELERLRAQQAVAERRLSQAQLLLTQAEEIRCRYREMLAVQERLRALNEAMLHARSLEQRRSHLDRDLQDQGRQLAVQLEVARQSLAQLRRYEAEVPGHQARVEQLKQQVAVLETLKAEEQQLQARLVELAGERAAAAAESARLKEHLRLIEERFHLLKEAEATCPVCEEKLSAEKRLQLGRTTRAERDQCHADIAAGLAREQQAQTDTLATQRQVQEVQRKLKTGENWRRQLAEAEQTLAKTQESVEKLPEAGELAAQLEKTLATGDFAQEIRAALEQVDAELARLGYDEVEHRALQGRTGQIQQCEREMVALEQAERDAPAAEEEVRHAAAAIAERQAVTASDEAALAAADRELKGLADVEAETARLEREFGAADARHSALARELGSAQSALEHCRQQVRLLAEKRAARDESAASHENHDLLSRAFGRNGIQALIIENAIPELEQEANELLARMTDNEMSVRFLTQRATKTAGVAETLEIEISDSLGSRRYELFSGGEAFRVNFAIRVALSKLLARRAGARLKTLVIDEGFGSQDAEGRERLVEAIHSVQEDFERIIVITHVEEMKEYFPTRIEVTKTHLGSQVTVL